MHKPSILISILNWNNALDTIDCIASLTTGVTSKDFSAEIRVIDNGSTQDDYTKLKAGVDEKGIAITRLEENLGFTGGHNTSIQLAIENGFDYIWLLNNDATAEPDCLARLVAALEEDGGLGAVSPVIKPADGGDPIAAWGGLHEWSPRKTVWFSSEEESIKAHTQRADEIFVAGTAILLRISALKQIGMLDDRMFAYYDDSDLGVRLSKGSWSSKVVFNAAITHSWRKIEHLPNHVFYLMYRNELLFWQTHLQAKNKFVLRLKLVNQGIFDAIRLSMEGFNSQSNAALLGVWDFFFGNYGRPNFNRKLPVLLTLAKKLSTVMHKSQLEKYIALEKKST